EKRESQTVEQNSRDYYAFKAANYSEILAQMIVDYRLFYPVDCRMHICLKSTAEIITTQIFIVVPFGESVFLSFFSLTTSSGGNGDNSKNNSTILQIPPTSTLNNQPQQLSSASSKTETKPSPPTKAKTSKRPKPTKPTKTKTKSAPSVQSFTSLFSLKTSNATRATSNQTQTESFVASTSGGIAIEEASTTKSTGTITEKSPSTGTADTNTELTPTTELTGTNTTEATETRTKQATVAGTMTNAAFYDIQIACLESASKIESNYRYAKMHFRSGKAKKLKETIHAFKAGTISILMK
ncbi:unnamed protein product, partial [Didymodactylos carnosus]